MRLGIDLGTTRTLVAVVDRGNYPIVTFENLKGEFQEWYPSLVAVRDDRRLYGFEALERCYDRDWQLHRSFKRVLGSISPTGTIFGIPTLALLSEYLLKLKDDLCTRSNIEIEEPLEAVIGVPANANSNQRFLTLEAFRLAGFRVAGVYNEPSAAGIEYANRYRRSGLTRKREHLLVYDLGGGTFDASVIHMAGNDHSVVTSLGIGQLGGDDFDAILLDIAQPNVQEDRDRMLEICRLAKERLTPNTRKIVLAFPGNETIIPVDEFYERSAPLVERTVEVLKSVLRTLGDEDAVGCIYVVGGASDFPLVLRILRATFGRRVRRSPYPHAATAIGLAIAADEQSELTVNEMFTRHFGVWREAESGAVMTFDSIFPKDSPIPARKVRSYQPVHNIGHFRYLECGELDASGRPGGDLTPWDDVLFPFDPQLSRNLDGVPIRISDVAPSQSIEEIYTCDENGIMEVRIANRTAGYERTFRLKR